ncbi:MAG: phenylalanine--tRNA ligase subunit beta, partial [Actinomycetia bacterium]|nr:phenylalanine--tRNA ligase subunit beta [Actinomycetes bacterium]
ALRSEASTRFERGVDYGGVQRALDRFTQLAVEICGATVARGAVLVDGNLEPTPPVVVRVPRVNMILNLELRADEITALLDPIGFQTIASSADEVTVTIPSWRPDSSLEIDVIEEIGRHNGYSRSGRRVPTPTQAGTLTPDQIGRRKLRRALQGAGYSEAMPNPFLAPGDLERAGLDGDGISLTNPLVAEESILRTSLLPGLLNAVAYNQAHRAPSIALYELGGVFGPSDAELPDECELVAAAGAGFDAADQAAVVATRLLHRLASELGFTGLRVVNEGRPGLHPTRSAAVHFRGKVIGDVGEVDPGVLEAFGVDGRVAWLQLEAAPLLEAMQSVPKYKLVSRYPSSDLDLAFLVANDIPASDVARTLNKAGGELLHSVKLFDVFRRDRLAAGTRSLAFTLRFQANDRTLTDAELADARQSCIAAVVKAHNAELRGAEGEATS